MKRKANAVWKGSGKAGDGRLTSDSGVLQNTAYSFRTRFENEKGTNPEELIAAAHAGCFAMQLAFLLQGEGHEAESLDVQATVTVEPEGDGFEIRSSALRLQAKVPGIERDAFESLARKAEAVCPVSSVLNADVSLEWTLE